MHGARRSVPRYFLESTKWIFSLAILSVLVAAPAEWPLSRQVWANGANATGPILRAAGLSSAEPILRKWCEQYEKGRRAKIRYERTGSGDPAASLRAGTVDFAVIDSPLTEQELQDSGWIQFPIVLGAVVPVYNIEGIKRPKLRLTPELLADIYLGSISTWNDARLTAINPDVRLPGEPITVVYRSDACEATRVFTSYLSKVCDQWKESVGSGSSVAWPTGVEARDERRVAEIVKGTSGTIGYVEYPLARREKLNMAVQKNKAGRFVSPTTQSFRAAVDKAAWRDASGFAVDLVDQPGRKAWPMMSVSYVLMAKEQPDREKARAMLTFFDWCFDTGEDTATQMKYLPVPSNVSRLALSLWANEVSSEGHPVWKLRRHVDTEKTTEGCEDSE